MKAAIFEQFGNPAEVLSIQDRPLPEPGRGEVRVRMLCSPINPSDLMTVQGIYGRRPDLPAVPGYEGVGIVEAAGGGLLPKFMKGKRVAALNRSSGNWQEHTILPARQVIPLPDDLPTDQAAMFFVNPATAFLMTRRILPVSAGDWLLQTAAASAVGKMVIRLGKKYGFRTINIVRRESHVDELTNLGGDAVLVFDELEDSPEDLQTAIANVLETAGGGSENQLRWAIDPVGGRTASAIIPCLGMHGRMLVYGTLSEDPLIFSPRDLMKSGASVEGFWLTIVMNEMGLLKKLRLVRQMTRLFREGILGAEISQTFPLEQISEAVTTAASPDRGGKVLLQIGDSPD